MAYSLANYFSFLIGNCLNAIRGTYNQSSWTYRQLLDKVKSLCKISTRGNWVFLQCHGPWHGASWMPYYHTTTPYPTMLCFTPFCDPVYYIYCLYFIMLIKTIVQLAITIFSSIPTIGSQCCTMYCILHLVSFVNTLDLNRDRHRRRQSMIKI